MAQVCGGTTFDLVFERKHNAAHRIMSAAADIWAASGRDAIDPDAVLAVMLRIFLQKESEWGQNRREIRREARSLKKWLSIVGPALQEATALLPQAAPRAVSDALFLLSAEISCAADQWSLGNPEQPPTAQALNSIEHILFTHKLTRRPASAKLPTTVRNN
jgi:hypothetical protein